MRGETALLCDWMKSVYRTVHTLSEEINELEAWLLHTTELELKYRRRQVLYLNELREAIGKREEHLFDLNTCLSGVLARRAELKEETTRITVTIVDLINLKDLRLARDSLLM